MPKIKSSTQSKKHLARLERERLQTRYLTIGSIVVILIIASIIGYAVLDQTYLRKVRPIAVVNGENIPTKRWEAFVRFSRNDVIRTAIQMYSTAQIYAGIPQAQAYYAYQIQQVAARMEPANMGQSVMDDLIQGVLLEQEAKKRGITLSDEELDQGVKETFGYFANGTPTATATLQTFPTPTLSGTQYALISPTPLASATLPATMTPTLSPSATITATVMLTPTATATTTPTVTPTSGPTETPTPYTLEGFQSLYASSMKDLETNLQFTEADFRFLVAMDLYREKLKPIILEEKKLNREQDMVWARHILVSDEKTAKEVLDKLNKGEDFSKLAAEYSIDTGSKDAGGDVGWFYPGFMIPEFEKAAYALKIGEISQPVQTTYGWHIIQVLDHEKRMLTPEEYAQFESRTFSKWLSDVKEAATIKINNNWQQLVPTTPAMPQEITDFISTQLGSTSPTPQVTP